MDVDMPIPPSIADSDDEAPALPPPPPVDLAHEEENDISPNLFLTRDSSPEELQPQSSSGRELAVCILLFVIRRRPNICST